MGVASSQVSTTWCSESTTLGLLPAEFEAFIETVQAIAEEVLTRCDVPCVEPACMNDLDLGIYHLDPDGIDATALNCAQQCMVDVDPKGCATDCVSTGTGLSAPCSGCYADFYGCGLVNCVTPCLEGWSRDCAICYLDTCGAGFLACSGRSP